MRLSDLSKYGLLFGKLGPCHKLSFTMLPIFCWLMDLIQLVSLISVGLQAFVANILLQVPWSILFKMTISSSRFFN